MWNRPKGALFQGNFNFNVGFFNSIIRHKIEQVTKRAGEIPSVKIKNKTPNHHQELGSSAGGVLRTRMEMNCFMTIFSEQINIYHQAKGRGCVGGNSK